MFPFDSWQAQKISFNGQVSLGAIELLVVHVTHSAFTVKMLCWKRIRWHFAVQCQCIFSKSFFGTLCLTKRRKKNLHHTEARTRLSCICLMITFHLNTNCPQRSLQKIVLCLLPPPGCHHYWQDWETCQWQFRTESNCGIHVKCKWIFLGFYLWISLILIHVHWSLTYMEIQCNKGFSSTYFNFRNYQKDV